MNNSNLLILLIMLDITSCTYSSSRSFEGREVDIKEVPFTVLITSDNSVCTGFLVDVRWVITAGHCVENTKDIIIAIGRTNRGTPSRTFTPEKIIFHPKNNSFQYDIVLLKLKMTVKLNEYAQVIAVDSVGWPNDSVTRRRCYVVGYGYNREISQQRVLYGGEVTIGHGRFYDINNCHGSWLAAGYWTYYNESVTMCHGYSGGPLVCDNVAVGVAIAMFPCKGSTSYLCEKKVVSAFLSLYDLFPWMKSYIECLPKCSCYLIRPSTVYTVLFVFICLSSGSLFC